MMRIDGEQSRGYQEADFHEVYRRYIPRSEVDELRESGKAERGGSLLET
jgi:hypothetical protein